MEELNEDVVVMDAEDSNSHTAALGYDINEVIQLVYDFQLDAEQTRLDLPPILGVHRALLFDVASKKMGLVYKSCQGGAAKPVTLRKPKRYEPKVWSSPYGPEEQQRKTKKRGYSSIPVGVSEILDDFLFLGSGKDADNVKVLVELGVTHVLNVTSEWRESPALAQRNLTFCRIPVKDYVTTSLDAVWDDALVFIDSALAAGGRIFVHCVVGKSRSTSVVCAWLISRREMTLHSALSLVKERRPLVRPNDAFIQQLHALEEKHCGCRSDVSFLEPMKEGAERHEPEHWAREHISPLLPELLARAKSKSHFAQLAGDVGRAEGEVAGRKAAGKAAARLANAYWEKHRGK